METKTLEFEVFRDPDGKPTCARHVAEGKVCRFLRSSGFGGKYHCGFNNDERIFEGKGCDFLKPIKNCPFWKNEI